MNSNVDSLTIGLIAGDTLDVDAPLLPVHARHLALAVVVVPADDHDLVVPTDWQGTDVVLGAQVLAQRRAHNNPTAVRRGCEVRLARFAAGHAHSSLYLHRVKNAERLPACLLIPLYPWPNLSKMVRSCSHGNVLMHIGAVPIELFSC